MKTILLSLTLVFSIAVFGQSRVGNGGSGFECPDGTLALIDFQEGRSLYGFKIEQPEGASTVDEIIEVWMKRLERLNPSRAELYRNYYQQGVKGTHWTDESQQISSVSDVGTVVRPASCQVVQIAIQNDPGMRNMRLTIDSNRFKRLSLLDQAGLYLHEVVWRDVRAQSVLPHTSANSVRRFTALIASDEFKDMELPEYLEWLADLDIEVADGPDRFPISMFQCRNANLPPDGISPGAANVSRWDDRKKLYVLYALEACELSSNAVADLGNAFKGSVVHRLGTTTNAVLIYGHFGAPDVFEMNEAGQTVAVKYQKLADSLFLQRKAIDLNWAKAKFQIEGGPLDVVFKDNVISITGARQIAVQFVFNGTYQAHDPNLKPLPGTGGVAGSMIKSIGDDTWISPGIDFNAKVGPGYDVPPTPLDYFGSENCAFGVWMNINKKSFGCAR